MVCEAIGHGVFVFLSFVSKTCGTYLCQLVLCLCETYMRVGDLYVALVLCYSIVYVAYVAL